MLKRLFNPFLFIACLVACLVAWVRATPEPPRDYGEMVELSPGLPGPNTGPRPGSCDLVAEVRRRETTYFQVTFPDRDRTATAGK